MEKVRLGIAGPGRIVRRVMKDLRKAEHVDVRAVASRDGNRARAAAEEYGIPLAYASYADMASSGEIDLAYVALPHPFHCQTAKLFLENGVNVIVEKPFAVNGREAREMVECARERGLFLMEAMWTRFFPAALALKARIQAGELGEIRRITGDFSSRNPVDLNDRLYNRALGGGSLLDVGVYPLSLMCYYMDALPEKTQTISRRTDTGVDEMCAFQALFPGGGVGQGYSGLDADTDHVMKVYGALAWAEIPHFWHPTEFTLHRRGAEPEVCRFDPENEGFHHEFEYAARAILAGKTDQTVISLAESVAVMDVMDDMRRQMGVTYPGE